MKAAILDRPREALRIGELDQPEPGSGEVLIAVEACGVCRTDLHLLDGEIPTPRLPLVPGHEIVGRIEAQGPGAERFAVGTRVGVPWLAWTCGKCRYCRSERENLCANAIFTGQGRDGGYAEYTVADERFCLEVSEDLAPESTAPLLCAGLIGYRALRLAGDAQRLGIYGFGAAAHIVAQVATRQGREVFAFTRPRDTQAQQFALELGAVWAGDSEGSPPEELDGALIFAPVGELVPAALRATSPGASVVCAGIHMSTIPAMDYELLWGERILRSVANLTRQDGERFMALAARTPIRTHVHVNPLDAAPEALESLRAGRVQGAEVLIP